MDKKKIYKGLIIFTIGFLLFFIFRLIYGYVSYPAEGSRGYINQGSMNSISIRNYASSKLVKKNYKQKQSTNITVDQKYERVASLVNKTKAYAKDEKKLRVQIKKFNALIQYEQKSGLKGKRRLVMAIGVNPDKFDEMVTVVGKIGKIISKNIKKTDKTNEYKDLNAKKKSLMKIRNSLISLKNRGGKINEFINLENRILEIENKIQTLGVNLGEFDSENEFCTIRFTLTETKMTGISFLHRVKVALEWSIQYYLMLNIILIIVFASTLLLIILLEKLDFIPKIIKKYLNE